MTEIDTLQIIRKHIRKEIDSVKEHLCYGIDNQEQLLYARGKLNALEALLQDLTDLQNREEVYDDFNQAKTLSKK